MRRKRPSSGETQGEGRDSFMAHLPVPVQPDLEQEQVAYADRYRPNSVFLAHLIATRDSALQSSGGRESAALSGANSYRATAAMPRRRAAGRLLNTER